MTDFDSKNMDADPVCVRHADLHRYGDSSYKSECPVCGGALLMGRDQGTFELLAEDRCVRCYQVVIYADIEDLRLREKQLNDEKNG